MSIRTLPIELVSYIVEYLSLDDFYSLSRSCKHFCYLRHDESVCKRVLLTKAPAAAEAQTATLTGYSSALRTLLKRRLAISSASPFLVAILAVVDTWIYENGTLAYTLERQLRILDLRNSPEVELVVDIRRLLDEAIDSPKARRSRKYKFSLLHYSDNILSCLYTHSMPEPESWLLVFNARENRLMTTIELESTYRLFVRNNDEHLFYGTHSEFSSEGYRRWVLRGYSILEDRWSESKVHLSNLVGSELGQTICFEIFGGFFYALSNQTSFVFEEIDWTSYYHCLRFPLSQPKPEKTQTTDRDSMWRRQHAEGPIDDRYTFLRIEKDETSGRLRILESRREWPQGNRESRRAYYKTDLVFAGDGPDDDSTSSATSANLDTAEPLKLARREVLGSSYRAREQRPPGMDGQQRSPDDFHIGDEGGSLLMFTLSKLFIRSYYSTCNTFLDLVDDPHQSSPNEQRLRLRVGSRSLRPAASAQTISQTAQQETAAPLPAVNRHGMVWEHNPVKFWPPSEGEGCPTELLGLLHQIMNPPKHLGSVHGISDEKGLVYATGGKSGDDLKALVLVSFDPSLRLKGLPCWSETQQRLVTSSNACRPDTYDALPKGRDKRMDAGNSQETCMRTSPRSVEKAPGKTPLQSTPWSWEEKPMFQTMEFGLHFVP